MRGEKEGENGLRFTLFVFQHFIYYFEPVCLLTLSVATTHMWKNQTTSERVHRAPVILLCAFDLPKLFASRSRATVEWLLRAVHVSIETRSHFAPPRQKSVDSLHCPDTGMIGDSCMSGQLDIIITRAVNHNTQNRADYSNNNAIIQIAG